MISDPAIRDERLCPLYRFKSLGNLLRIKVKSTLETAVEQVNLVNTTLRPSFIALKGGDYLPINAILKLN